MIEMYKTVPYADEFINAIAGHCKMVGHVLRHPEELHINIVIQEDMMEGKKTGGSRNYYTGQIKNDAKGKTLKEKKEMDRLYNG